MPKTFVGKTLTQAVTNPFKKETFSTYRDWEKILIMFMGVQARNPDLSAWQELIVSEETLEIAYGCAIVLANLITYDFPKQSSKLFQISSDLKPTDAQELEAWLHKGWLNIADVQDSLQAILTH